MKISNPAPAVLLQSKIVALARDLTAASGVVSSTGLGFMPTRLDVVAMFVGAVVNSFGFADNAGTIRDLYTPYTGLQAEASGQLVTLITALNTGQYVDTITYDVDGFSFTWTKWGTPTGNAYIRVLASR